ncbi:MAG: hypothetical protein HN341_09550 [Verrucomicrobia bacterium]|nr:hypothetical protein [Verrucomicrobiota bacterium]
MDSKVEFLNGVFICTSSGEADAPAVADVIDEMLSHPEWKPGMPRCYDISDLDAGSLTVNDIRLISGFAAKYRQQTGAGRIAIVAGGDLVYGLSRMLSIHISELVGGEPEVFRSRDEALVWLSA